MTQQKWYLFFLACVGMGRAVGDGENFFVLTSLPTHPESSRGLEETPGVTAAPCSDPDHTTVEDTRGTLPSKLSVKPVHK